MSEVLWLVIMAVGVAATVGITLAVQRHRYVESLRARGWEFVTSPSVQITHGLNLPPFGVGFNRRVDDQIIGRSQSGVPFQAFEYDTSVFSSQGYVVTMPLPQSMPECYLLPRGHRRAGIQATLYSDQPLMQIGQDPTFVEAVAQALMPIITQLPPEVVPDISVDHANLVAVGVAKPADTIARTVEVLARAVQRLSQPDFQAFVGPVPPAEMGVYGHPGWIYRTRDDAVLSSVRHTGGGQNHQAKNIFMEVTGPLPFIALTHHWETTRTVTETDSEGRTTTRTVTDYHQENLREFHPQFNFGDFKVNSGLFGNKRTFESQAFNDRFTVRCPDPRFASDIFHPRMMEFMLAANPPPFSLTGGHLSIDCPHSFEGLAGAQRFLYDFFGRVPNFVWENLGHTTPPVPRVS